MALNWTANNETNLKGYNVAYMPKGGSSWTYKFSISNYCIISGLTNGQEYDFKVDAVNNSDGESSYSSEVTATPSAPAPSSEDAITAFSLAGTAGSIDSAAHTVTVAVPSGTDVSNLAAAFTLSLNATATVNGVTQVSGTTMLKITLGD